MKILDKYLGDHDHIELYPVSDLHLGSNLCDLGRFRDFTTMIMQEPNRYIIVNGDMINNNMAGAVGTPWEDIISPSEQKKAIKKELLPLKDRIIVMISGNHERRTKKANDENPLEDVAEYLGVPYREEDCYIKLSFGKDNHNKRISYLIYVIHGAGGGKRPGASLNNIESLSLNAYAEIYIMGHVHKKTAHKALYYMPDPYNNNLREIEQLYVISSSWQSYGGYGKLKMMRPSVLGSVPIYLDGRRKYYEARV